MTYLRAAPITLELTDMVCTSTLSIYTETVVWLSMYIPPYTMLLLNYTQTKACKPVIALPRISAWMSL